MSIKHYLLFILSFCFCVAGTYAQGTKLYAGYLPAITHGTVAQFLNDIQQQTNIAISYSDAALDAKHEVKLLNTRYTIKDALETILAGQKVGIVERDDKILIVPAAARLKAAAREQYTINGYIKEAGNKEVLIGSVFYIPSLGLGVLSNSYGFYSITLPKGSYTAVCSYTGYKADTFHINVNGDIRQDVFLSNNNILPEVVVDKKTDLLPERKQLLVSDIYSRPALLGENEIMRALQNLSGVQCGVDGTSSVLVRGGDPGQNLSLLDGVPVYNVDHFYGLTSVFNTDAIKSVDFYKGAFPARYGGRLSSVIDVNTRDGSMQNIGGQFTMGLIKATLNLEGPVIKDKASVLFAARRSWIDGFWRLFTSELKLDFYDLNGKVNYILNKNNRLYLSFYNGRDQIMMDQNRIRTRSTWGNSMGAAKWNCIISPKLFVNTILTYSTFKFQLQDRTEVIKDGSINNTISYTATSTIQDGSLNIRAHWYPTLKHKVETGIKYAVSEFNPATVKQDATYIITNRGIVASKFQSNEINLFAEDQITVNEHWTLRPGLHWATWIGSSFNYSSLQPRMYVAYKPSRSQVIYGSFTQMAQFLHMMNNNTIGLPADFWLPSTAKLEPEEALLGAVGYMGELKNDFSYNIECYYKDIRNVTTYNVGKNVFENAANWEEKLIQGKGWSYGTEITMQKKFNKLQAITAYTLSRTWRQFDMLNNGKPFPFRYDRRHNLKAALIYQPNKKFTATANWTYMSGEAITIPDQVYTDLDNNLLINASTEFSSANYTYHHTSMNSYRLPAIHRLDLSFDFYKKKKRAERTWSVGIFNAYGRRNVISVLLVNDINGNFTLKGFSFFQYIPYLSYKLKF